MRHLAASLLGVVLGCLALAGCGSGGGGNGSPSPGSGTASGTPSTSASTPAPPAASSSAPSSGSASGSASAVTSSAPSSTGPASWCTLGDLRLHLSNGNGAAGTDYYRLRMTNTSASPCRTGGYGGVSLVARPDGPPLGAPAVRTMPGLKRVFTLAPGASASAVLAITVAENYPRSRCHPAPATGLRVYPPDETHSVVLPIRTTGCSATSVHLLRLQPYSPVGA
jgi:hypothetical protein